MPPLLTFLLCWSPAVTGCDLTPLLHPEQVTYAVPYRVRAMVASLACPLSEAGVMQACATWLRAGEWPTGTVTCLSSGTMPDPDVGEVYDVREPVAINLAGRSDGCAP